METNTDVIQGTLDLLILKPLSLQPLHGFGIARHVAEEAVTLTRSAAPARLPGRAR